MSKFAKNIKNNAVIGWVVVSVECQVRALPTKPKQSYLPKT
jgi:hypothetical protein